MMFPSLSNLTWISSIPEQSLHSVDTISSFAEISSFVFYAKYIACGRNACLWMVKRLRGIDSIPLMVFSGFLAFLLKSHIFVGYGMPAFYVLRTHVRPAVHVDPLSNSRVIHSPS